MERKVGLGRKEEDRRSDDGGKGYKRNGKS